MGRIPMDSFHIPPVYVEAEAILPPTNEFQKRPAQHIVIGDLLLLSGKVWRVKECHTSRISSRITFTLWPVSGGRPETESFFPREWIPVMHFPRSA